MVATDYKSTIFKFLPVTPGMRTVVLSRPTWISSYTQNFITRHRRHPYVWLRKWGAMRLHWSVQGRSALDSRTYGFVLEHARTHTHTDSQTYIYISPVYMYVCIHCWPIQWNIFSLEWHFNSRVTLFVIRWWPDTNTNMGSWTDMKKCGSIKTPACVIS